MSTFTKAVNLKDGIKDYIFKYYPDHIDEICNNKDAIIKDGVPTWIKDSPSATLLPQILAIDPVVIKARYNNGIFARSGIQVTQRGQEGMSTIIRRGIEYTGEFKVMTYSANDYPTMSLKFFDNNIPIFRYGNRFKVTRSDKVMSKLNGVNVQSLLMEAETTAYTTLLDNIFAYGVRDEQNNTLPSSYGYLNAPDKTPIPLGGTMKSLATANPVDLDNKMKDAYNQQTDHVKNIQSMFADLLILSPEDNKILSGTYLNTANGSNISLIQSLKMYVRELSGRELKILPDTRCTGVSDNNNFVFFNSSDCDFIVVSPLKFFTETLFQDDETRAEASIAGLDFKYDTLLLFSTSVSKSAKSSTE